MFMETIQNVVHDDTNPKVRNKLLKKKNLNLNIKVSSTKTNKL